EFIVLLADIEGGDAKDAARAVAEKCIAALDRPFAVFDAICTLGVSIGIVAGDASCSAHTLLVDADRAMYRAKEAGRGRYHFADDRAADAGERAV
ncbi:diguanylate cyclase domain-containing protein, partial [Noviherbaspirillum denitrificans]|uniref:diguanylate cyclase domain-containing protein n=1 Tax=Noviherbaspirillum denitrificans TaxID=1968433 RepID=UPI00197E3942